MPRFRTMINSFVSGEVSPKFRARSETKEYAQACEIIENATILRQGGAQRRAGFQYQDFLASLSGTEFYGEELRAIPFIVSSTEAYIIILRNNATFLAVNYETLNTTTVVANAGISGYQWSVNFGGFGLASVLPEIKYAQKGSLLYLLHPDYNPMQITRLGVDSIGSGAFYDPPAGTSASEVYERFPYRDQNINTEVRFKISAITGTITVNCMDSGGTAVDFFDEGHIGVPFILWDTADTDYLIITPSFFTNANTISAIVQRTSATGADYLGAVGYYQWSESAWSDYRGWPRAATFFDSRLIWGGNAAQPATLWGSQIDDIYELTDTDVETDKGAPTNTNDMYFRQTLDGETYNLIQWMKSSRGLWVGTETREFVLQPSDPTDTIGRINLPTNSAETQIGSSYVQPSLINNSITFCQRSAQGLRDMIFNENENAYFSRNLSVLAEHIHKKSYANMVTPLIPKITQMEYQQTDNGILWVIDNNGGLIGMTIDKELGIRAWHYHKMSGTSSSNMIRMSTSITAANPIVLTSGNGVAHLLTTGNSVKIRGYDGSTSAVNGTHTITVVDSLQFSLDGIDGTGDPGPSVGPLCSLTIYNSAPKFLSLAVLPSPDGTHDDLWATVQKTIDGVDEVFLVKMGRPFEGEILQDLTTNIVNKPIFMDLAEMNQVASFPSGTPVLVHSGFDHMKGEVVQVVADGAYVGDKTVSSSGEITLDTAAQEVIAGFLYETRLKILPLSVGSAIGSALGAIKGIDKVIVKFFNSVYAKIGRDKDDSRMEEIVFRESGDAPGAPIPRTLEKDVDFSGDYERSSQVEIFSDKPYPMVVNGISIRAITYD